MELDRLHQSDLIEITYLQQSGNMRWYRWKCTAVYLGVDRGAMDISFRPHAGTSQIPVKNIENVEVIVSARHRPHQRGDLRAKLPRRLPGAVSA